MRLDPIKINQEEYEYIINHKRFIGAGEDGAVYYIGNGIAYKFYHNSILSHTFSSYENLYNKNRVLDPEGVNIAKYKVTDSSKYITLKYFDEYGVRLVREEALYRAIERQKDVVETRLPQNLIYINGKSAGCSMDYYSAPNSIYKAARFSKRSKLMVLKYFLLKYKELIDHNIYPIDLSQRDKYYPSKRINSNVLLNLKHEPIIIDLDGKSAIYTEKENQHFLKLANANFSKVVLEIITGIDLNENVMEEDIELLINDLIEAGINPYLVQKFIYNNSLDINDTKRCIDDYALNHKIIK